MKLPMIQTLYLEDKLIKETTNEFELGEQRSTRVRCPSCFSLFTAWKQYVDRGDGFGEWRATSKPHCNA